MQRAGAPKGNSVQVHATNNQSGLKNETLANMRENAILQGETSHASVAQLDRASVFVTDDGNPQSPCSSKTCEISEPCDSHSLCQTPVKNDSDLAHLIDAWPDLPNVIKEAILTMVNSISKGKRHER